MHWAYINLVIGDGPFDSANPCFLSYKMHVNKCFSVLSNALLNILTKTSKKGTKKEEEQGKKRIKVSVSHKTKRGQDK